MPGIELRSNMQSCLPQVFILSDFGRLLELELLLLKNFKLIAMLILGQGIS